MVGQRTRRNSMLDHRCKPLPDPCMHDQTRRYLLWVVLPLRLRHTGGLRRRHLVHKMAKVLASIPPHPAPNPLATPPLLRHLVRGSHLVPIKTLHLVILYNIHRLEMSLFPLSDHHQGHRLMDMVVPHLPRYLRRSYYQLLQQSRKARRLTSMGINSSSSSPFKRLQP